MKCHETNWDDTLNLTVLYFAERTLAVKQPLSDLGEDSEEDSKGEWPRPIEENYKVCSQPLPH